MTSHTHKHIRALRQFALALALALQLFAIPAVHAASTSGAISQGYETTSSNISQGTLVSVISSGSASIEPANSNNASNLVGIAATKPALELSDGSSTAIQVVVNGSTEALVSDANGTVHVGDKITPSPISGIGMKAVNSAEIVGTALKGLSAVSTITEKVAGQNGKSITLHVGLLPIAVNVAYYSASPSEGAVSSFVPPFLQNVANAITGRPVSALRVLLGFIALLLGFAIAVFMLYVSIHSDMISIGRNPLAESALRKGLIDVILGALGVLLITSIIVYAVLLS